MLFSHPLIFYLLTTLFWVLSNLCRELAYIHLLYPLRNIVPMRDIVIIGHKAKTNGDFSLNDLPGAAGRMDILCRCVSSALFLSFGMRRDVNIHLLLLGDPDPGKIIRFEGLNLRYLNPDERSSGSLIQKALQKMQPKRISVLPQVSGFAGEILNHCSQSLEGATCFT